MTVRFLFLALFASGILHAQTKTFTSQSKATFNVANMYVNTVEGTVEGAEGTAVFEDGILTEISGALDAHSILSGNSLRDTHLREKSAFFNTSVTPKITFQANSIVFVGKSSGVTTYKLEGSLTLRGKSNDIEIEVTETSTNHLVSTFTVNRDLWGLGEGYPKAVIARDIEVTVDIYLE